MKEKVLLKDQLFNVSKVHHLASEIKAVYPAFNQEDFEQDVLEAFPTLELKARIEHIGKILYKYLPSDYTEALKVIQEALPEELDTNKYDNDFGDFIYSPYASYVAAYGCREVHLELSLCMLRVLTKRFSVEFAIRDFINAFPKETLAMLKHCALSDNYHERRLASEGLRPKLPWAKKLKITYSEALPLLDFLYADPTRYVTRSVANHLNDISKIDPKTVLKTLEVWKASGRQKEGEMAYIISHSLRTLVKHGNVEALCFLGFSEMPHIELSKARLDRDKVSVGEHFEIIFHIKAKKFCSLMLDYVLHFQTKNGKTSPKVHKIQKLSLKAGESVEIRKKHLFKKGMTTRTLYAGKHKVELQINGKRYDLGEIELSV